jgi:hypothetical protein
MHTQAFYGQVLCGRRDEVAQLSCVGVPSGGLGKELESAEGKSDNQIPSSALGRPSTKAAIPRRPETSMGRQTARLTPSSFRNTVATSASETPDTIPFSGPALPN